MPSLPFRVRRVYFDQIVSGIKTAEFRRLSDYWSHRVQRIIDSGKSQRALWVAVFLCGRKVHRRRILKVSIHPNARAALGREPTSHGRLDLGDGMVVAFHLGEEVT